MHSLVRAKIAWFTDEGHEMRGVVHIGANDGEEVAWYLQRDHRPVLAFEPHPEPFGELQAMYGDPHGVICVNMALGDRDGELTLQIPEDGDTKHASKYPPVPTDGDNHAWTLVPNAAAITVPLRRFDSWAAETCIDLAPFDVLVIDVQGMELEVLRGMGRTLDGFRFLNIECSEQAMYDGEASAQEVIDWLRVQGFEPQTPIETHDDILFLRVREPEAADARVESVADLGRASESVDRDSARGSKPVADPRPPLREWARENGWPEMKDGRRRVPDEAKQAYAEAFPG